MLIKTKNYKQNYKFIKENPTIQLHPDYIMFESFGLNYTEYYFGGIETAKYLIQHLNNYIELKNLCILEWGCGPARIIRHFPELIKFDCRYFTTDYNLKSINWYKKNKKY